MTEHVVVVGAGVGGLVSAALLAARGFAVTVCEAQATPGGKLRAFDGIDAGPTVFTLRTVFEQVFAECGETLGDHLTATSATLLARHAWGEQRLDLFADPAASEDAIGDFAGAREAGGYRAFRAEAARIFRALDRPFLQAPKPNPLTLGWRMGLAGLRDYATLHPYTSLWRQSGRYFRDPRLRQLFGRYATYCGSSPFACPATLMLVAHVEAAGVWLIDGGMHRLADVLAGLAKRQGAVLRYAAPVAEVTVERGRVAGVRLANGERVTADAVILNADPAALAAGRFGWAAAMAVAPMPVARRSLSALVWLGEVRADGFPLTRHNVFFSEDYAAEFAALGKLRLAARPTVYLCAQDRADATPAPAASPPDGHERVQLIVNAPATGDGPPLSPEEMQRCTNSMTDMLSRAGLSLRTQGLRLLTPRDFEALNPSTGGALYGPASHGWAASFRRQGSRTRIPGLYCAGGSTHPGAGVPMAALSGRLAADCLRKDRASTSGSIPRAMPGGMSTPPATTAGTG